MNDNKRIAWNSIILYGKLLISVFLGLWTSRIVLNELGASDFGLYAVVGGIISLLNVLSTSMVATTYRFIAVEIGRGKDGNTNTVFNTLLIVHLLLALFLLIIGEIAGIYYIKNYLNIEQGKIPDALFVLHYSMIATCFTVISIPYQGLITAKEDFLTSAIINIVQAVLKLGVAFSLIYYTNNKLRLYAITTTIVILFTSLQFYFNCRKRYFDIIKWHINRNIREYRKVLNYNFWILIGALAHVGRSQGSALILNLFFGTVINAAYGVANQLNNFISHFVKSLNGAAVPQITKSYSGGDRGRSMSLVYSITKYSFFLMLLPVIPILLSIDEILSLWLKEVPVYTKEFVVIMMINGLLGSICSGFDAAIQATGNIRNYQVTISIILLSSLLISYLLFTTLGVEPYFINIIFLLASFISILIGIRFMSKLTSFSLKQYLIKTISRVVGVTVFISPLYFLRLLFSDSLLGVIIFSILTLVITLLIIYFVGLELSERIIVRRYANKSYHKIFNRA